MACYSVIQETNIKNVEALKDAIEALNGTVEVLSRHSLKVEVGGETIYLNRKNENSAFYTDSSSTKLGKIQQQYNAATVKRWADKVGYKTKVTQTVGY